MNVILELLLQWLGRDDDLRYGRNRALAVEELLVGIYRRQNFMGGKPSAANLQVAGELQLLHAGLPRACDGIRLGPSRHKGAPVVRKI